MSQTNALRFSVCYNGLVFASVDLDLLLKGQALLLGSFGTPFFIFGARWLILGVGFVSVCAWLFEREANHRHTWKEVGWSVLLAFVMSLLVSELVRRVRPFLAYPDQVRVLIPAPASAFSWPSSHASTIWAWAMGVSRLERRVAGLWIAIAVYVSLSRVVVGVHYPLDVLAGAGVGTLSVYLVRFGHRWLRRTPSTL